MSWLASAWAWVAEHWPWLAGGTGLLLVVGALVVLNPAAALGVASQVVGLVLDWVRRGIAWLRKPGNATKAICAALALAAAYGMLSSYRANERIVVITRDLDTATQDRDKAKGRVSELEASLQTYQQQEQTFANLQRERTDELDRLRRENKSAMDELRRLRRESDRNDGAWWRVYEGRSDVCRAAEEALDVACAEVGKF